MKTKSLMLVALSSFALGWAGVAHAQILTDGGFESSGVGTGVGNKGANGYNSTTAPGWSNVTGGGAGDSGVQNGTPTTSTAVSQDSQAGNYFAFEEASDTNGGGYQLTSTKVAAGDLLTLTWYAANDYVPTADGAGAEPTQVVDIFTGTSTPPGGASTTNAESTYSPTILATTAPGGVQTAAYDLPYYTPGGTNATTYQEYTLSVVVPLADASQYVGVSFATTGAAGSYANYDSFTLTDTAAATPEPSSLALALVGVGGLFLVNRFRRSLV